MEIVFVDTSAWLAVFDRRDKYHSSAKKTFESLRQQKLRLITTDYIFDETITSASNAFGYSLAVKIGDALLNNTIAAMAYLEEKHKEQAWEIFKKHGAMHLSFTDCTSFAFMNDKKLNTAFTFDRDFESMGFQVL